MNRYKRLDFRLLNDGSYHSMHRTAWLIGALFGHFLGRLSQCIYGNIIIAIRRKWYMEKWYWKSFPAAIKVSMKK